MKLAALAAMGPALALAIGLGAHAVSSDSVGLTGQGLDSVGVLAPDETTTAQRTTTERKKPKTTRTETAPAGTATAPSLRIRLRPRLRRPRPPVSPATTTVATTQARAAAAATAGGEAADAAGEATIELVSRHRRRAAAWTASPGRGRPRGSSADPS